METFSSNNFMPSSVFEKSTAHDMLGSVIPDRVLPMLSDDWTTKKTSPY